MASRSEQINELADALSKAQSEIEAASRDTENPFFKHKYADLASVWSAARDPLCRNGLSVSQLAEGEANENGMVVKLTTMLLHRSGQFLSGEMKATPVKQDPQGIGSCITYLRRYALAGICGIVTEDDDGNAASGNENGNRKAQRFEAAKKIESLKEQVEKPVALPLDQQISPEQRGKLFAEAADAGRDLHEFIKDRYGLDSIKQIHKNKIDGIIEDLQAAAIPRTKSKPAAQDEPSAPEDGSMEPLLRMSTLVAKLKKLDPTQDIDVIVGGFLRTTKDEPVSYTKLRTMKITAKTAKWVNDACDRMEREFSSLLTEQPETDADLPL